MQSEYATSECADVVVIGGGPAGSAAALCLARRHRHVIQIERRIFCDPANDRLRSGEGLIPRTRHELAALGIDTRAAPWIFSRLERVRVHWFDGTHTTNSIARRGGIIQIDREGFDKHLFDAALQAGVDGRQGWRALRLYRDDSGRVAGVVAQLPDGQPPRLIRAPVVIDAGGRNALALRELNLRVPDADCDFFGMAMFFDQIADLDPQTCEMHLFDPQQVTIFQISWLSNGLVRCGLGTPYSFKRAAHCNPKNFFWARLRQYPLLARRLANSQMVRPPFARAGIGYQVRQVTFDGLLLAGDACGYINPLFGDGILRALQTARHAADTIEDALRRGDCSRAGLAPYARRHAARNRLDWFAKHLILRMHRYPHALCHFGRLNLVRQVLFEALMRN